MKLCNAKVKYRCKQAAWALGVCSETYKMHKYFLKYKNFTTSKLVDDMILLVYIDFNINWYLPYLPQLDLVPNC